MSEKPPIRYIGHAQIDKAKWDHCIRHSSNGRIYAYSFYLDQMADRWDALVEGDYEIVMPLTWRKKFSISYLYQPFLTAQLGIFGKTIDGDTVDRFLAAIPSKFRLIEIALNPSNFSSSNSLQPRMNYILDLQKTYDELQQAYRENIRRNIRKARQVGCTADKGFDVEQVITLAVGQMREHGKESAANVERFRKLFAGLERKEMALTYGIRSPHGELIASAAFLLDGGRAYYILVGNHPNGKTIGASHALIDEFIKDHAGKNITLDFEGSDIQSLAFFYSSFGATEERYPFLRVDRLPFYVRWLR